MYLPTLSVLRPESVEEAIELLTEHGDKARLYAGGTDLFPRIKYRVTLPEVVVSLKKPISRARIIDEEQFLSLDAVTPLAQMARSETVREHAPILAEAASAVGSYQIRNMGTLGGNLCLENRCMYYNQSHTFQFVEPCFKREGDLCYHIPKSERCWAVFCGDTAPALISLGAQVEVMSAKNTRRIPVEHLYSGYSLRPLAIFPSEMVSRILIPKTQRSTGSAFLKLSLRGGMEFAGLSVAALLEMMDDRATCQKARIVVGSVSSAPRRAAKAEAMLARQKISSDLFHEVAATVSRQVKPYSHHGFSVSYLKKCLKVYTRDALVLAAQRLSQARVAEPRSGEGR
jgi:4-hydroxybenzoyl-CoA reductase beta subunit